MVTEAELSSLAESHDIITLGMKADAVRRARHGAQTTFVRVAMVSAVPGEPVEIPPAAGEVRITGEPGSHAAAIARVAEVARLAGNLPVSAFSLADLEALAAAEKVTVRALLEELRAAGLELISEAPFDRLRDPRRSVEEVNIAGLTLARLTLQQLPSEAMLALYRRIDALQYDVAVVRAFAPLPRTFNPALPTTGFDDVRRVALARLCLSRIPSIQVDWSLYGPKLAQVALTVGADDLDAVSAVDDSPDGRRRSALEEVRRNIVAAALTPVARTARFDIVADAGSERAGSAS
jgi:hypothetical protein